MDVLKKANTILPQVVIATTILALVYPPSFTWFTSRLDNNPFVPKYISPFRFSLKLCNAIYYSKILIAYLLFLYERKTIPVIMPRL